MPTPIASEIDAEILRRLRAGERDLDISRVVGVSYSTVHKRRRDAGIIGKGMPLRHAGEIERLLREGRSDLGIARALGCDRFAVARARRSLKLEHARQPTVRPKRPDSPLEARIRANYSAGLTDYENAQALGLERWKIQAWRRRWALAPNGVSLFVRSLSSGSYVPLDVGRATECHRQGMSDVDIGRLLGVNRERVRCWRSKAGLSANRVRRAQVVETVAWRDPLWAACRTAIGTGGAADIADDAAQDMVLATLEGRLDRGQIMVSGKRFYGRALNSFASRWGSRSLDEDRNGEGWTLYASLPDPSAETSFRLIELMALARAKGLDPVAIINADA